MMGWRSSHKHRRVYLRAETGALEIFRFEQPHLSRRHTLPWCCRSYYVHTCRVVRPQAYSQNPAVLEPEMQRFAHMQRGGPRASVTAVGTLSANRCHQDTKWPTEIQPCQNIRIWGRNFETNSACLRPSGQEGVDLRLLEDDQGLGACREQDAFVERPNEIIVVPILWASCVQF